MKDHKLLYLVVFLLAAFVLSERIPTKEKLQTQAVLAAPNEIDAHLSVPAAPSSGPGFISINPVAFRPQQDGYDFFIPGDGIIVLDQFSPNYYAAVNLPHGTSVNRLTCYWIDWSTNFNATCNLNRAPMNGAWYETMASVESSGSSGVLTSSEDTTINYPVVDNSQYSYFVHWYLPYEESGSVSGHSVLIEYGYNVYLPLTER